MSYAHTDQDGTELSIQGRLPGGIYMHLETRRDILATTIPTSEAPALALAILESAGFRPTQEHETQVHSERYASVAVESLGYCITYRAKESEREAEDAKVREFFTALNPGFIAGDVELSDRVREQYRAARDYFTNGFRSAT